MNVVEYGKRITSVTLRRGPCFGRCPVYDVTLAADGVATWSGERFVDRVGRFQGQVDLNNYSRLARFIQGTDEPPDFWVIATLADSLAEAVDWIAADLKGDCHDWTAVHDRQPPGPPVLTVRGACTFPTPDFSVELRRHEPQGINPRDLLLDRIEHPPAGPVPAVHVQVQPEQQRHREEQHTLMAGDESTRTGPGTGWPLV
jgi:hypothetical protein